MRAVVRWGLPALLGLALSAAVAQAAPLAYITNYTGNSVSVIATATNEVVATVGVGSAPNGVAVTPDGAFVYVANFFSNTVSVIATASNTVATTVPVGSGPIAFSQFIGPQVGYDFAAFFPPVDNLPVVNRLTAGQAVPVKFSLGGRVWPVWGAKRGLDAVRGRGGSSPAMPPVWGRGLTPRQRPNGPQQPVPSAL